MHERTSLSEPAPRPMETTLPIIFTEPCLFFFLFFNFVNTWQYESELFKNLLLPQADVQVHAFLPFLTGQN